MTSRHKTGWKQKIYPCQNGLFSKCRATNGWIIHGVWWKACFLVPYGMRDSWWYVCNDVGCLMNHPEICPINLPWESVSSQAVCHSFILAQLGMVIGSQSTSNRWIGPRLGWLRGAAVGARVYSFVCGGAWPCTLARHARCCCLQTTAHLCHSISSLSFEFGVLSIIAGTAAFLSVARGLRRVERCSCERLFLTLPSNYYQDTAECNPSGNEHSSWRGRSICSQRLGSVGDVEQKENFLLRLQNREWFWCRCLCTDNKRIQAKQYGRHPARNNTILRVS